jgi:uncharacterized protein involved in exopolysaccharide biosynthesis
MSEAIAGSQRARGGDALGSEFAGPRRWAAQPALRNVLIVAAYYRRWLILAFLVPALLGLAAAVLATPAYVAEERLLVLLGSEYVYQPEVGQAGTGTTLDRNQIMQSEMEILQSQYLRAATVRKVGLARMYPDLAGGPIGALLRLLRLQPADSSQGDGDAHAVAEAAERLRRNLTITTVPQTNVIELAFRSSNRDLSAEVLNTLVQQYFDRRAEVFRPAHTDANAVQDRQAEERLRDAEAALARFSEQHQIASFDEQMTRLIDQQAAISTEQLDTAQTLSALQAQIATLRREVATLPHTSQLYAEAERPGPAGSADLVRLESLRNAMAEHYQPDAPQLRAVDEQLARARAAISSGQSAPTVNRVGQNPEWLTAQSHLQEAMVDLQGAMGRQTQLQRSMDAIDARLDELNTVGAQYRDLKRARDVLAETFNVYSHNREEARLADALDRGRLNNIRIVQPAVPPATGSAHRAALLGGGILVGLLFAATLLAVLNAVRQTALSVDDLERIAEVPVLVAVPFVASAGAGAMSGGRRRARAGGVTE